VKSENETMNELYIQKVARKFYGDQNASIYEITKNKITVQQANIIDTLVLHLLEYYNSITKEQILLDKIPCEQHRDLQVKIARLKSLEVKDCHRFDDYPARLAVLVPISNFDIEIENSGLSKFTGDTATIEKAIEQHLENTLLPPSKTINDNQGIIDLGITLAIAYGQLLTLQEFANHEYALIARMDELANVFFWVLVRYGEGEEFIGELVYTLEKEKRYQRSRDKRKTTTEKEHEPTVKFIEKMSGEDFVKQCSGKSLGVLATRIREKIIQTNAHLPKNEKLHPYSTDQLKIILIKYFNFKKGEDLPKPLIIYKNK
jgi:hypothetical protein